MAGPNSIEGEFKRNKT